MKRTHDELLAGFPKYKITQVCLSFSTSSSTEAFLSRGTGGVIQVLSDILNVVDQRETKGSYFGEF